MKKDHHNFFNELLFDAMAYIESDRTDAHRHLKAAFDTISDYMTETEIESAYNAMMALKGIRKISLSAIHPAFISDNPQDLVGRDLTVKGSNIRVLVVDVKNSTLMFEEQPQHLDDEAIKAA